MGERRAGAGAPTDAFHSENDKDRDRRGTGAGGEMCSASGHNLRKNVKDLADGLISSVRER